MKHLLFALLILGGMSSAWSQSTTPVNYSDIEAEISNPASKNYYPKLLDTYNEDPASLTPDQFRLLYYGFTFQEAYRPYENSAKEAELSQLMATKMETEDDYMALAAKSKEILAENPFNLKILYYLKNFNITLLRFEENAQIDKKFDGLIGAILSSGDGMSMETAFAINNIPDEYMLIRAFGLKSDGQEFKGNTDYVKLQENDFGLAGYYFDHTRLMEIGSAQLGVETLQVEDDEIPEDAVEIGSDKEIDRFIPLGYEPLSKVKGDLDGDGDTDWAIVFRKEGEELLAAAGGEGTPRMLMVLTRADDGLLDVAIRNSEAIPCYTCGGDSDPLQSVSVENGKLSISTVESGLLVTERLLEFVYNTEEQRWLLETDRISSYKKGKEEKKQTLTETAEDFGKVALREFVY